MNYYYHHIGDFKKDTAHLTHQERSIYLELLWMYYDQEQPLENNIERLSRLCRTDVNVINVILTDFFYLEDDVWHHTRVDSELTKMYDKSEKCRMAVEKRWSKDKTIQEYNESNTDGIAPKTQDPKPKTQVIYSDAFNKFWKAYPNKIKKDYSWGIWKKNNLDSKIDIIIKHIEHIKQSKQWKDGYIQHPSTYLNQKMYLDDVVIVNKVKGRML